MRAKAVVILLLLSACNAAELSKLESTASADFAAGCADWQSVSAVAGEAGRFLPSPLNQAAAITEAFVGDACTNQNFIDAAGADEVAWIKQSTANLKAIVASGGSARLRVELALLPSTGEKRR
jgi:homoaconitase/3-isopropylmalate dehydratase large subunit